MNQVHPHVHTLFISDPFQYYSIQFFNYLCTYSTAQKPIIKRARAKMETKEHTHKQRKKTKQGNLFHLDNNTNEISTIESAITKREKCILSTINILIRRKNHNKIQLRKTVFITNTPTSLQTSSAAEANLSRGTRFA
jgi:hypothetical protein